MAFLTALGSALANRLTLSSELSPQPRLYTIVLGESADVRKSTVIKKVVEFFQAAAPRDDIDIVLPGVGFDVSWGVGSAEGLQKKFDDNGTPRILLCLDEFRQFVSKCRIEASVLLPCVNTLFENNCYDNQTKKSRISLRNAHLSILAASTTDTFNQIWTSAFTAIGFNNRLFIVPGEGKRKYPVPSKIPEENKNRLIEQLKDMLKPFKSRCRLEIYGQLQVVLIRSWRYRGRSYPRS